MKVQHIVAQADEFLGKVVEVEGIFSVLEEDKQKVIFVAATGSIDDTAPKLFIEQPFAEIKAMIRPLNSLLLLFRSELTNPPYFYRFPIQLEGKLVKGDLERFVLSEITNITIEDVPYVGKTADYAHNDSYTYTAQIDYTPYDDDNSQKTARASIHSQKILQLSAEVVEAQVIADNQYARPLIKQDVELQGYLQNLPAKRGMEYHIVLATSAVRSSVVAVGLLRETTHLWLKPSDLYKLLKAHMPVSRDSDLHQAVSIIGQFDYLQDDALPIMGDKLPKLVFTKIYQITIHEQNYLW